jgi:hypothetical protein
VLFVSSSSVVRGVSKVAAAASTPRLCHWQLPGNQPQCSSGRQHFNASKIRRQGCHLGTQGSPRWIDMCSGNPSSLRQCRPPARRWRSTIGGVQNLGSPADNAKCASQHEVGLPRVIHVEAGLLDNIGDVGAGECQVLKGTSEAPELSWISNRRP